MAELNMSHSAASESYMPHNSAPLTVDTREYAHPVQRQVTAAQRLFNNDLEPSMIAPPMFFSGKRNVNEMSINFYVMSSNPYSFILYGQNKCSLVLVSYNTSHTSLRLNEPTSGILNEYILSR